MPLRIGSLILAAALSGCFSVRVPIDSLPSGASYRVIQYQQGNQITHADDGWSFGWIVKTPGGTTPAVLDLVAPATYLIEFNKPGYEPLKAQVSLESSPLGRVLCVVTLPLSLLYWNAPLRAVPRSLVAKLNPVDGPAHEIQRPIAVGATDNAGLKSTGSVACSVDASGAEIYVDGQFVGNAPATLQLSSGTHVFVVNAPGCKEFRREMMILAGSEARLDVKLERLP